ncbi:MAG: SDR family NAD(P)-dependent oxidoreductase, partial [Bacilli bacterium]
VASAVAFQPTPYLAVYGATKSFVLHYTEAIAAELRKTNIHVMTLCPGGTATEFNDRAQVKGFIVDKFTMKPTEVVRQAIEGIKHKKYIVVPGLINAIMTKGYHFMPRKGLTHAIAKAFKEEK